MSKFNERLVRVLKENGISQVELFKRINMSQGIVNNYSMDKENQV